jgi:hypothetical protein
LPLTASEGERNCDPREVFTRDLHLPRDPFLRLDPERLLLVFA